MAKPIAIELVRLVRDSDCPACGFPEMVSMHTDLSKKGTLVGWECSKTCGYVKIEPGFAIAAVYEKRKV